MNHYKISEKKLTGISQLEINNWVFAPVFAFFSLSHYIPIGYWKPIDSEAAMSSFDTANLPAVGS